MALVQACRVRTMTNTQTHIPGPPASHHVFKTNVINSLDRLEKPHVFFPVLKLYPFLFLCIVAWVVELCWQSCVIWLLITEIRYIVWVYILNFVFDDKFNIKLDIHGVVIKEDFLQKLQPALKAKTSPWHQKLMAQNQHSRLYTYFCIKQLY